jgi:hypothetical protein
VELENLDFSGRHFDSLVVRGPSLIDGCDFSRVQFDYLLFDGDALVRTCSFQEVKLPSDLLIGPVRFERCVFSGSFRNVFSHAGQFVDCTVRGRLDGCTFFGRPSGGWEKRLARGRNEFLRNDFSAAELRDCAFRGGIDLDDQVLPEGSLLIRNVARATLALERVSKGADTESIKRSIKGLIGMLRLFVDEGQQIVFLSPYDLPSIPTTLHAEIMGILQES